MALTLILIRHCKSDWSADLEDHARPLNPRGRRSAPRLGAYLAAEGLMPEHVLCSDARRTQETWAGIAPHLPGAPAPDLRPALYLAEPATLLAALRSATGTCTALIGHNPGIAELAQDLAETPPADERFHSYPTGATCILTFENPDWTTIHQGQVQAFTTPRDLPDPS